ncbi:MAG: hypothetical protein Q9201_001090 [Fulgogasparrea decipioides]
MDSMADKASVKSVRKALGNLPDELEGIYEETFERICRQPEDLRRLAERTLRWVTYAYRPLSLRVLQHALAVEPGELDFDEENVSDRDAILNACCGLVIIDHRSDVMRLVHYTTQQYVEANERFSNAHAEIAKTCIAYLSCDTFQSGALEGNFRLFGYEYLDDHPLLRYASYFWGAHAKASPEALVEAPILDFLTKNPRVYLKPVSHYNFSTFWFCLEPNTGFSTAAFFGLHEAMARLKPESKSIDNLGYNNLSALHLAARNGQHTAIRTLVEWGASIDCLGDKDSSSPLIQAIRSVSHSTIKLLLKLGADVNKPNIDGKTPLIEVLKYGDLKSAYILVKGGAEINIQDVKGRTPLHRSI